MNDSHLNANGRLFITSKTYGLGGLRGILVNRDWKAELPCCPALPRIFTCRTWKAFALRSLAIEGRTWQEMPEMTELGGIGALECC